MGGNSETTIFNIANLIGTELDVSVNIPENIQFIGSPNNVNLNMSKYESEFGDFDKISIENGIRSTITWCKFINNKINK